MYLWARGSSWAGANTAMDIGPDQYLVQVQVQVERQVQVELQVQV